ncbi:MAG: hypothetical protein REI11_10965 [Patulibacter sp.]|nr:hypothetical protein [Patulibacter sp.]
MAALPAVLDLLATGALTVDLEVVPGLEGVGAAHDALAAGSPRGKYVVAVA